MVAPAIAEARALPEFRLDDIVPFLRRANYNEPWHESRLVETAKLLPRAPRPDAVYLDLGTHPLLIHAFARYGGYRSVWGANWDPDQAGSPYQDVVVAEPEPAGESFQYRVFNVNFEFDRLPLADGSVDVVTCLEVIEHITSDPMHPLIEINRVLRDGGTLVLSTPNVVSWASLLRAAKLDHPMLYPFFFPGHYTNRHNIEYTPSMVRSMLRSAGFEGSVGTIDAWSQPAAADVERLVKAGFQDFDRGDCILARVRKAGPPVSRYDPLVYELTEDQLRRNHRVVLDYRNG